MHLNYYRKHSLSNPHDGDFWQNAPEQDIANDKKEEFIKELLEGFEYLNSSRPTAVNLSWAIEKQKEIVQNSKNLSAGMLCKNLIENAIKLENEDIEINKKIGDYGAEIIPKGAGILTHCNAGALATVGYGTALGVVRSAFAKDNTVQFLQMKQGQGGREQRLQPLNLFRTESP